MRKAALHLPAIERAAIPLLNFLAKPRQYHPQAIRCLYLSSGAMGLVVFCLSVMYLFPFIDSYGWTTALAALTLIGCVAFAAAALGARGLVLEERRNMLTGKLRLRPFSGRYPLLTSFRYSTENSPLRRQLHQRRLGYRGGHILPTCTWAAVGDSRRAREEIDSW